MLLSLFKGHRIGKGSEYWFAYDLLLCSSLHGDKVMDCVFYRFYSDFLGTHPAAQDVLRGSQHPLLAPMTSGAAMVALSS